MNGYIGGLPAINIPLAGEYGLAIIQNREVSPVGFVIDGPKCYGLQSSGSPYNLFPGTLMVRNASGAFQTFIIGALTVAALAADTTLTVGQVNAQSIQAATGGAGPITVLSGGVYYPLIVASVNTATGVVSLSAATGFAFAIGDVVMVGTVTASNSSASADPTLGAKLAVIDDQIGVWTTDIPTLIQGIVPPELQTPWGNPVIGGYLAFNRVVMAPVAPLNYAALQALVQASLPRLDATSIVL